MSNTIIIIFAVFIFMFFMGNQSSAEKTEPEAKIPDDPNRNAYYYPDFRPAPVPKDSYKFDPDTKRVIKPVNKSPVDYNSSTDMPRTVWKPRKQPV